MSSEWILIDIALINIMSVIHYSTLQNTQVEIFKLPSAQTQIAYADDRVSRTQYMSVAL